MEIEEKTAKMESCIRENPGHAIALGVGTGVLLAQLPLRLTLTGVLRLAVCLLKPALVAYGLFRFAEDYHEGRCPFNKEPPV